MVYPGYINLRAESIQWTRVGEDQKADRFSVVVADDSEDIRALIKMVLERDARFDVVAVVRSGPTAVAALRDLQPDLATFDLHMDGMADLTSLKEARTVSPRTKLIVVTGTYRVGHDPDLDLAPIDDWMQKDQIMSDLPDRLIATLRDKDDV